MPRGWLDSQCGRMQHPPEHDAWNARARLIAATLGLGGFLANFDVTSVVVVMPAIGTDLGIPVDGLAWIIDAYSIAFTATLLVAGALADRFGRRRTLLVGNIWFLVDVPCLWPGVEQLRSSWRPARRRVVARLSS